jgi:hypothetical protein
MEDSKWVRERLFRRVPIWEEYPHTPAVFVRMANKGLTAYVKWKSAEALENKGGMEAR